jgi:DNA-directed RNA polymerase specialized sigma24 family protein
LIRTSPWLARLAADTADQEDAPGLNGLTGSGQVPRRHAIIDRLAAADIEILIALYCAGTTIRELAEKHSISETAIKALLRKRGVRRRGRPTTPA